MLHHIYLTARHYQLLCRLRFFIQNILSVHKIGLDNSIVTGYILLQSILTLWYCYFYLDIILYNTQL